MGQRFLDKEYRFAKVLDIIQDCEGVLPEAEVSLNLNPKSTFWDFNLIKFLRNSLSLSYQSVKLIDCWLRFLCNRL